MGKIKYTVILPSVSPQGSKLVLPSASEMGIESKKSRWVFNTL